MFKVKKMYIKKQGNFSSVLNVDLTFSLKYQNKWNKQNLTYFGQETFFSQKLQKRSQAQVILIFQITFM